MRRLILIALLAGSGSAVLSRAEVTQPLAAPTPRTQGVNHIGFTVKDLDATATFFSDALGWKIVGGDPDYPSLFVTDGDAFVTLWRASDPETAVAFDRKTNIGLHHFAMTVADLETLDELHAKLAAWPGVTIEFAPEFLGHGPTQHMMIRDPSGLRLEFIVPDGRRRDQK